MADVTKFPYYGEIEDYKVSDEQAYEFAKDAVAFCADDIYNYDYLELGEDDKHVYGFLVGWIDGYDPEDYGNEEGRGLCIKMGYMPKRGMMYDFEDWLMPYNEDTGDVWDTCCSIGTDPNDPALKSDVAWLMKNWREFLKDYQLSASTYYGEIDDGI